MVGENGVVNRRTVGRAEWKKTKMVLVLKLLSLRCPIDIHVEFREEVQAGNTIMGVNSV